MGLTSPRHELAGIFYGENLEVIGELITFAREINFKSHGGIIYYYFYSGEVVCEDGRKLGYVPEYETDNVRRLIGVTDPNNATWRHRITGTIEECEEDVYDDDEKPRKFFVGQMYIAK